MNKIHYFEHLAILCQKTNYVIHWKIEKYECMYYNCKIVNKKKELMIVAFSSTRTKEVQCLWNWRQEGLPFPWSTKARYRDICNTDYLIWYCLSVFVTIVKSFTRKLIWPISWIVEKWHECQCQFHLIDR